jgi:hypothetical protein
MRNVPGGDPAMTVQIIRRTAKEFAGAFYEQNTRTPAFRRAYPTLKDFMTGRAHARDGSIRPQMPGWMHFVDAAKHQLTLLLTQEGVHEHIKTPIYEALVEQAKRGSRPGAQHVLQTGLDKRDDQQHAYNPELIRGQG